MKRLAGKAVVVTGAARGLGEAYVRGLYQEGASIILNDVDSEGAARVAASLEDSPDRVRTHCGDVTSWKFTEELVDRCVSEYGRIDGLVNNAGVLSIKSIDEQDEKTLRTQIEVNLIGQANCGYHALRKMRAKGSGAIVNTYSGAQAGGAYRSAYSAAMAGVAGLTYAWASECEGSGVRVNAIAPIALTPGTETGVSTLAAASSGNVHGSVEQLGRTTHTMTAEMIVPMVVYLLSDLSSAVNGQGLRLAGRDLMIMGHPGIWSPILESESWTVEAIHEAFGGRWKDRLPELGLGEYRSEFVKRVG